MQPCSQPSIQLLESCAGSWQLAQIRMAGIPSFQWPEGDSLLRLWQIV